MFTPLRRFEFGKMLLNIIPVLVGAGFVSKIFTDLSWAVKIAFIVLIAVVGIIGFLFLPESLAKEEKERGES